MPDGREQVGQDEIDDLLKQAKAVAPKPMPMAEGGATLAAGEIESLLNQAAPRKSSLPVASTKAGEESLAQGDIEYLLNQAQEALASVDAPHNPGPLAGIAPFELEEFSGAPASTEVATIELIRDVELDLKIELGRTQMYLEEVLKLRKGSVVPLDKLAGDPVDIYVNGRLIARGEVLVLNDNFCVRVAELVSGEPTQ
jgi:flagellar motor switch protein FliN/FliY